MRQIFSLLIIFALAFSPFGWWRAFADTASELQSKINTKNDEIKKLQAEIDAYEKSLNQTTEKAKSLQNELAALNLARKKLEAELKKTNANLSKTKAVITDLSNQIVKTEDKIDESREGIAASLRNVRLAEDSSPVEIILGSQSLSEISSYVENSEKLEDAIREMIKDLEKEEQVLNSQKLSQEEKQAELKKLQTNLSGQERAVSDTAKATNKMLAATKNEESNYQKILNEKVALRAQFEKELFDFESQLKITIDRGLLPDTGTSALRWPLANIFVTQQFGKTSASGRLYSSGTHNGIDLRATDGTAVLASLSGTVTATGDTDQKPRCYSYGKWILLKHGNGLSTLYAHLSSISVSTGQSVATGETIGYSGRTGYATGPHLHFTVLATQGVQVMQYPASKAVNCGGVTIPIADPKAFLDPLLYLPPVR